MNFSFNGLSHFCLSVLIQQFYYNGKPRRQIALSLRENCGQETVSKCFWNIYEMQKKKRCNYGCKDYLKKDRPFCILSEDNPIANGYF